MKIGIPRGLYYYYYNDLWVEYFKNLKLEVVISKSTDLEILKLGYINDDYCLPVKIFLGHVSYLQEKCDYIFLPLLQNFGEENHVCNNFNNIHNLVLEKFNCKLLCEKINYKQKKTLKKSLINIGKKLGFRRKLCFNAYKKANNFYLKNFKSNVVINKANLMNNSKKILIVAHPYILYDDYLGKDIIKKLSNQCQIIYSDLFDKYESNLYSKHISQSSCIKFSKELIGTIPQCLNEIDGVVFITSIYCNNDIITYALASKKIGIPFLNLIIDEINVSSLEQELNLFIDKLGRN